MVIEVKDRETFIPTWNGNDKKDEGEQIRVHYRYPTPGERSRFFGLSKDMAVDQKSGDASPTFHYDPEGLVKAMVTRIENLQVGQNKVETASQLYTTRGIPQALVQEIESAIMAAEPKVDADFLQ